MQANLLNLMTASVRVSPVVIHSYNITENSPELFDRSLSY